MIASRCDGSDANRVIALQLLLLTIVPAVVLADRTGEDTGHGANMLFILIDDMGCVDLSCYGGTRVGTPQIDRLARECIRGTLQRPFELEGA